LSNENGRSIRIANKFRVFPQVPDANFYYLIHLGTPSNPCELNLKPKKTRREEMKVKNTNCCVAAIGGLESRRDYLDSKPLNFNRYEVSLRTIRVRGTPLRGTREGIITKLEQLLITSTSWLLGKPSASLSLLMIGTRSGYAASGSFSSFNLSNQRNDSLRILNYKQ
jgi:hypothetical protein